MLCSLSLSLSLSKGLLVMFCSRCCHYWSCWRRWPVLTVNRRLNIWCFKGVLLCSFTKSWFCFGGVLEHPLMVGGSKITLFFTLFTLLQYLSPQPDPNDSISSGFDEGPPSEKLNVLWLVSCPNVLWLANSLDGVSVLPRPLPKQQVLEYCHINSDLENTEQEDHAEPLHALDIARHIKVVMLLLFLVKSCFK